jgi:hypothetical protein
MEELVHLKEEELDELE